MPRLMGPVWLTVGGTGVGMEEDTEVDMVASAVALVEDTEVMEAIKCRLGRYMKYRYL